MSLHKFPENLPFPGASRPSLSSRPETHGAVSIVPSLALWSDELLPLLGSHLESGQKPVGWAWQGLCSLVLNQE